MFARARITLLIYSSNNYLLNAHYGLGIGKGSEFSCDPIGKLCILMETVSSCRRLGIQINKQKKNVRVLSIIQRTQSKRMWPRDSEPRGRSRSCEPFKEKEQVSQRPRGRKMLNGKEEKKGNSEPQGGGGRRVCLRRAQREAGLRPQRAPYTRDWGLNCVLLGNHGKVLDGGGEGVCDLRF